MGLLGKIGGGLGNILTGGGGQKQKPYFPKYTPSYERWQRNDIASLYRNTDIPGEEYAGHGYEGPGLGYNDQEMQGLYGEGRDLSAGEAAGETQRTTDRFRSSSGMGLQSAMYARAQQRSDLARVARANELKRRMVVENAQQKRADKLARIAAVTGAYQFDVGGYNQWAQGKNNIIKENYALSQSLLGSAGSGG